MQAPARFEQGAGLLAPELDAPPPESFDVDTTSYFDQLTSKPTTDLSSCFPDEGPRFIQQSDDALELLEGRDSVILSVWSLSPVAISPDGQHALIAGGMSCGGLCGGGAYYLFGRVNGEWTLLGHKDLWVS